MIKFIPTRRVLFEKNVIDSVKQLKQSIEQDLCNCSIWKYNSRSDVFFYVNNNVVMIEIHVISGEIVLNPISIERFSGNVFEGNIFMEIKNFMKESFKTKRINFEITRPSSLSFVLNESTEIIRSDD
jgi:hypothetical protein